MARKQTKQSEAFKAKARELEADESGEAFERAFRKIVPPKTATQPSASPRPKRNKA